jgi:hypothetical protein
VISSLNFGDGFYAGGGLEIEALLRRGRLLYDGLEIRIGGGY